MNKEREFKQAKTNAMQSLSQAISDNQVDSEILPVLQLINKKESYYTTSSCAGRIVVIEMPKIGDKQHASFLGKWHHTVQLDDINKAIKKAVKGYLWLLAQSTIIHVGSDTIDHANTLMKCAISSGFKNTGIKTMVNKLIIEINSTERMDVPIGKNGEVLCSEHYLNLILSLGNDMINRSGQKLHRFQQSLENI